MSGNSHSGRRPWLTAEQRALRSAKVRRPDITPVTTAPPELVAPAPKWVTAKLKPGGRRVVLDLYEQHSGWSARDFALLRQLGQVTDDLDAYQTALRRGRFVGRGTDKQAHPALKLAAASRRMLMSLFKALDFER